MKKLIRNRKTGVFFSGGVWVQDVGQAQVVKSALEAWEIKSKYALQDVDLYYLYREQPSKLADLSVRLD